MLSKRYLVNSRWTFFFFHWVVDLHLHTLYMQTNFIPQTPVCNTFYDYCSWNCMISGYRIGIQYWQQMWIKIKKNQKINIFVTCNFKFRPASHLSTFCFKQFFYSFFDPLFHTFMHFWIVLRYSASRVSKCSQSCCTWPVVRIEPQ